MLGSEEIRAALRRRPFAPFRLVTSDGITYDVRHPDLLVLTHTSALIGYPDASTPDIWVRFDIVGVDHVIRIEELPRRDGISAPTE
jgi:hypothetical protein